MKVTLDLGEAVEIAFVGTDGTITVAFVPSEVRCVMGCDPTVAKILPTGISVHADMPDGSGREGIIYHESGEGPQVGQQAVAAFFRATPEEQALNALLATFTDLVNADKLAEAESFLKQHKANQQFVELAAVVLRLHRNTKFV